MNFKKQTLVSMQEIIRSFSSTPSAPSSTNPTIHCQGIANPKKSWMLYSMQQLTKPIIFTVPYMTSSEVEIGPSEKKLLPIH